MKTTIRLIIPGILSSLNIACTLVIDLVFTGTEKLMAMEGNSANKKDQKLSDASAAVADRLADNIRHPGATSANEAMKLLRTRSVAKQYNNRCSVNSNIFTSGFTNRLIVIDDSCS